MKSLLILLLVPLCLTPYRSQKNQYDLVPNLLDVTYQINSQWTPDQILKANTGKDIIGLSDVEKESILYLNLARLYPSDFAKIEMPNYFGTEKYGDYLKNSEYRESLIKELKDLKPRNALRFNAALYDNAKCFSKELGESGEESHQRKNCKEEDYAECLSYGMETGKDIAMQWLIDDSVPSIGHRKICLDNSYTNIAVSVHSHKKWGTCAVAELN
jgi:hypothetical protein